MVKLTIKPINISAGFCTVGLYSLFGSVLILNNIGTTAGTPLLYYLCGSILTIALYIGYRIMKPHVESSWMFLIRETAYYTGILYVIDGVLFVLPVSLSERATEFTLEPVLIGGVSVLIGVSLAYVTTEYADAIKRRETVEQSFD